VSIGSPFSVAVGYAIDREEDLGFAIRVHMSKRAGE
jgi:hypothetical protein